MSRAIPVAVLLGISCLAGCSKAGSAKNWREYKSEKYKFSAEFPYTVKVEEKQNGTKVDCHDASDQVTFLIAVSEFVIPGGKEAAWRELSRVRDRTAEGLGASVEDAQNMEVGGLPAISFTLLMTNDEGTQFRRHTRFILSKNRVYRQSVTVWVGANADKDVQKFFESFTVGTK